MQQPVRKAGLRFQRVAKGVAGRLSSARSPACRAIGRHDPGLGETEWATAYSGMPRRRQHRAAVRFAPGEEIGIVQQAVFDYFGVARAQLRRGQRGASSGEVGDHQGGLMERADQVFACGGVDGGLAANARIDLGQAGSLGAE